MEEEVGTRLTPKLATATASSDNIITIVTNCSDVVGCTRHREILSRNDRVASKNNGS